MLVAMATTPLQAQVMPTAQASPPMSRPDRTTHVTFDNVVIDESAVRVLFIGIFEAFGTRTPNETMTDLSQGRTTWHVRMIDTIAKDHSQMPAGYRYAFYAGRDPSTGHEVVWEANLGKGEGGNDQDDDEHVAAYALAALDARDVGEPWKTFYSHAAGDAARQALGRDIVRTLQEASDQKKAAAAADAAWIRRYIVVGLSRANAYAALRSYGLVPYNSAFNPGVPIDKNGTKGCDFSDQSTAAWPYHGEPLPKRTGECVSFKNDPGAFPSANITLGGAFNLGCSSEIAISIAFDNSDHVKLVHISDPEWSCV